MTRYAVWYTTGASACVEVEADDEDDAMEVADMEFSAPQPCAHCARNFAIGEWEPDQTQFAVEEIGEVTR